MSISETELIVLKALWARGPSTVRELAGALREDGHRWAYNTVLTLLQRLRSKGYVRSEAGSPAHIFRAAVSREEHLRERLRDLAEKVCDGTATPLVRAMVEGSPFSRAEVAELRDLIDRLDPEGRPKKGKTT